MAIYCFCAIFPVLIIFIYFYQDVYNRIENELLLASAQSLARVADSINKDINQAQDLANRIYVSESLYTILETDYENHIDYYTDYQQKIVPFLKVLPSADTKIVDYSIYTDNPTVFGGEYIRQLDTAANGSPIDAPWIKDIDSIPTEGKFYVNHGRYYPHHQDGMLFSYIRAMTLNRPDGRYKKIIKIDFEVDFLQKALESEDYAGMIGIQDEKNHIIAHTGFESVWQYTNNEEGKKYIQTVRIGGMAGWYVVGYPNIEYIKNVLNTQRNVAILLLALSCIISTWVVYRLINTIFRTRLWETQVGLEQKQAELNALRNQVDPHFLFNILETVRMRLFLDGQKNHSAVVMRMARLYRKLLKWESDLISISDEIDFIHEYMSIQNYRYGDELEWTMEIEGESPNFRVPKMLLQTFVENACKHGLNENGKTLIEISLRISDNSLHFMIRDNGSGFSDADAANVSAMLSGKYENPSGIGISNAIQRMRLYYGDSFSLSLNTGAGKGTMIAAVLPKM